MAQGATLTPTTITPSTSTVSTLASGATATLALYVATGYVPRDVKADVVMTTPGADVIVATMGDGINVVQVAGPGVFKVVLRSIGQSGTAIGVCADPSA
jgi:hypothetical protein